VVNLKKQSQNRPSAGNPKSEYLNPKRVKEDTVLKKQTQSVPDLMSATSYEKGDYDNMPAGGVEENKAKQSQSPVNDLLRPQLQRPALRIHSPRYS